MKESITFETLLANEDITAITDFIKNNDENLLTYIHELLQKIHEPGDKFHEVFKFFIENQKKYLKEMNSQLNLTLVRFITWLYTYDDEYMQRKIAIDSILDAGADPFFYDGQYHSIFSNSVVEKKPYVYRKIIEDNVLDAHHINKLIEVCNITMPYKSGIQQELEKAIAYDIAVKERRELQKNLMHNEKKSHIVKI